MSEESEMWEKARRMKREQRKWKVVTTLEKERELLYSLVGVRVVEVKSDGGSGELWRLEVNTMRGIRKVDWWTATGVWKVLRGTGEGVGIYRLARYFQLIPKEEGR